jgi:hypothetical protein
MKLRTAGSVLCLVIASVPLVVRADEPNVQVARVSYTGGEVSYQRGDNDGWNALAINTPLVTGDAVYTADDGRAEVHLGGGNVLSLDAGTQVDLLSNTRDLAQLGLRSGYLHLRARSVSGDGTIEIDTPNGAATVLEPGVYRVQVTDGGAQYSAVKGRMSVSLNGQQLDVDPGQTLAIEGTDQPSYSFDHIAPERPIDRWASGRDVRADRSRSARYVHHDVVGYEDLDDNGTWRDTPDDGRVWMPSGMPPGWAPYQAGSWVWQDPYGWTWVSSEPWGWAPYHYGRWVSVGGAWGWVPPPPVGFHGPSVVAEIRPTYAPALVAFVGGRNWSVGVSLGGGPSVGWVPLAPAERYYYPWQPAPRVTNNYTNITVVNAVTIVNTTNFATGPIHPIHVPPGQTMHAPVMGYTPTGVVPTRDSLCASRPREPHSRFVPHHDDDRPLIVRTQPPPKPVAFDDRVAEIQRTGRPFDAHDRGEHTARMGHPERNDRIATVSALSTEAQKELTPRPGSVAKSPRRIDRGVDIAPRPEHGRPNDSVAFSAHSQPTSAPPVVAVSEHASLGTRNAQHASAPHASAQAVPVTAPDRSHPHPAATVSEWHAAPPSAPQPHPVTATTVAQANHPAPKHEAPKPEAPKANDEKAKGKEKHSAQGQQQDH